MTLRAVIVGCGAVAQHLYCKPLMALERQGVLRVTGLVDTQARHAESIRNTFWSAKTFELLAPALDNSDIVFILTPVHLHAEQALQALARGKHVLCEKPMAPTDEQCSDMVAAARKKNCVLAINMIRRFFPSYATLKKLITARELGELRSFSYRE